MCRTGRVKNQSMNICFLFLNYRMLCIFAQGQEEITGARLVFFMHGTFSQEQAEAGKKTIKNIENIHSWGFCGQEWDKT